MNTTLLITMLFVSILIGLFGLIAFLWGLKGGQFEDEKKFTHGALFDSPEALNLAIKQEDKRKNFKKGKKMETIYNIAIIGAGPGGMAASIEAKKAGMDKVILLEKDSAHSSTIRKFYKDGKRVDKDYKGQIVDLRGSIPFSDTIKEGYLEMFDKLLAENEIDLKCNTDIEKITKNGDYFEVFSTNNEVFKAKFVIIAIGKMGQPNKPDYKIPPTLLKKVAYNANGINPGETVLVVGGGNSAVEYAVALSEETPTTLNYRRNEFNRINEINAKALVAAFDSKLKKKLGVNIEKLEDNNGSIEVFYDDGTSDVFNRVVYAIGGAVPLDFLKKCGLELDDAGLPVTQNFESTIKGIYVIGDILSKNGASVATALNQGLDAINQIKTKL